MPSGQGETIRKAMTGKRKPRRRRHSGQTPSGRNVIVSTPLRRAFEALQQPRLNGGYRWECPSVSESVARLTGGRAKRFVVRAWCNGQRRAPTWFVAVLALELRARRDHIDRVLADLETVETGDRRRGPAASARGRATRMRQLGRPIGEKLTSDAPPAVEPAKNDPHI